MAAATPPDRDRHMDFLRVFSIAVVVLGHWLIAVVVWRDGHVEGTNALEVIDGLPFATWVLQVMPIFFFVGGFANLRTWRAVRRDAGGYATFLHGRLVRMLRPTLVFLGVTLTVTVTLDALNVADNVVFPASTLITRPLWFLGVYMIVVALTPLAVWLHDRLGGKAVLALAAAAAIVDGLRFGAGISPAGYFNYATVWLLAHQLGFVYADGLVTVRRARAMAVAGLVAMASLVAFGPYPVSMVGLGTDDFSNMDPPTLAIVALAVWQVGLVTALRGPMSAWLRRLRVWAGVIFVNSVIMTMFLWHLTAMLLVIGILYPLGWPQPDAGTAQWWVLRPVWVAALVVVLSAFVFVFGRFERRGFGGRRAEASPGPSSSVAAGLAAVLVILGILGFAIGGMHQLFSTEGTELIVIRLNPFQNVIHLALGLALLRAAVRPAPTTRRALVVVGTVLAVLAVTGALLTGRPDSNILAVNTAGTVIHATLAVVALAAAMRMARRR
jgi:fucose 4-O-acetylase-like acetyltransferase